MDECGVRGVEDIEYDLLGRAQAAEILAPVASAGVRTREHTPPTARTSETRLRLRTLLHLEANLDRSLDLTYLVASGCLFFEAEIIRLLVDPARPLGPALVSALGRK